MSRAYSVLLILGLLAVIASPCLGRVSSFFESEINEDEVSVKDEDEPIEWRNSPIGAPTWAPAPNTNEIYADDDISSFPAPTPAHDKKEIMAADGDDEPIEGSISPIRAPLEAPAPTPAHDKMEIMADGDEQPIEGSISPIRAPLEAPAPTPDHDKKEIMADDDKEIEWSISPYPAPLEAPAHDKKEIMADDDGKEIEGSISPFLAPLEAPAPTPAKYEQIEWSISPVEAPIQPQTAADELPLF